MTLGRSAPETASGPGAMDAAVQYAAPLRIVLDTNVWLDWLVFDDPCVASLRSGVAAGSIVLYIDEACEAELIRVLGYPLRKSTLDADAQAACVGECRRLARAAGGMPADTGPRVPLPVCSDPDDQKFLELASRCRADYLVTKDRALLDLASRRGTLARLRIVTPQQVSAALDSVLAS